MTRLLLVLVLLSVTGCAYYNGMYNANRLAGRAEKAERDGRTFDANNFWNQAIVKADSVLRRHPDSKWADDARLVRARALARLNRCEAAIPELTRVQEELTDPELLEMAALELGRCRLTQGDLAGAQAALEPLAESGDPRRRAQARIALGRARLAAGNPAGALEFLAVDVDSTVPGSRMLALAGAGQLDAARALADTLIGAGNAHAPWREFLAALGAADPASAAAYLDRVAQLKLDRGAVAELMLDDAARRLPRERAAALARLEEAERTAPGSDPAARARARRQELVLREVPTLDSLRPTIRALYPTDARGEQSLASAGGLVATAELVQRTADSAATRPPHGDLMLFLAAELARDSLRSPRLAADLMQRVADQWPASPYAPKALLAVMALDQAAAERVRSDLESLYDGSAYLNVAQGIADSTYRTLEDSLGAYALTWRAASAPRAGTRDEPRITPRQTGRPTVDRPRPNPGGAGRTRPGAVIAP